MPTPAPIALTERDTAKTNAQQGLYRKFDVRRTDGTDCPGGKHDGCEYFVLDMTHDKHARAALTAYADSAAASFPDLAADLRSRYALTPCATADAGTMPTQAMLDAGTAAMLAFRKSGGDWTDKPAHAAEAAITAAITALTPAPQVPGDMALCNAILRHQFQDEHRGGRLTVDVETLLHDYNSHKATPPLNELLGQPEELNLNEVSGNPGQLASLEQRARELLAAEYDKAGFMGAADDARADVPSPHCQVTLRAITAALNEASRAPQ